TAGEPADLIRVVRHAAGLDAIATQLRHPGEMPAHHLPSDPRIARHRTEGRHDRIVIGTPGRSIRTPYPQHAVLESLLHLGKLRGEVAGLPGIFNDVENLE